MDATKVETHDTAVVNAAKMGENTSPVTSLAEFRAAHSHLLRRYNETGATSERLDEIEKFVRQGQGIGAILEAERDRWDCQSVLDYWATLLFRAGRNIEDATLREFDIALAPELEDENCPYMGLDAFGEKRCTLFFGREHLVEEMTERLQASRFLAIIGPSGSGKSSLVRAGLLPALRQGAIPPDSATWRYCPPVVPGSDPLANLAQAARPEGEHAAAWGRASAPHLWKEKRGLVQLLATAGKTPAVVVVDQFEEIFTLCPDEAIRQAFVDNLVALVEEPGPRHTVILTMRSDFEPQMARYPDLQAYCEKVSVRVTPLGANELRDAIEKPAGIAGLHFQEGIVEQLVKEILGEPAGLPLLQFSLLRLWESRERNQVTREAYERLGGARDALAQAADELYESLLPEEKVTAKRILLRLVRPAEGLEVTSNRLRREDLRQREAPDRVDRVLHKFIEARLLRLTRGERPEDDQVEVGHEALIRNWPRLVEWLDQERFALRQRLRLTAAAELWNASGRDAGGLLGSGSLLEEAERCEDLNPLELEFVQASKAQVETLARAEEETRQRELENTRAYNHRLLFGLLALGIMALIATIMLIFALSQKHNAEKTSAALEQERKEAGRLANANQETARKAVQELLQVAKNREQLLADVQRDPTILYQPEVSEEIVNKSSDSISPFAEYVNEKNDPKWILWHTAFSDGDISEDALDRRYRARGYSSLPYHYVVRRTGLEEKGRPETQIGAHAGSFDLNKTSIGLCFSGNGTKRPLTPHQYAAGLKLTRDIMKRYGIPAANVRGHDEVHLERMTTSSKTPCPGKYIDMEKVRADLQKP